MFYILGWGNRLNKTVRKRLAKETGYNEEHIQIAGLLGADEEWVRGCKIRGVVEFDRVILACRQYNLRPWREEIECQKQKRERNA